MGPTHPHPPPEHTRTHPHMHTHAKPHSSTPCGLSAGVVPRRPPPLEQGSLWPFSHLQGGQDAPSPNSSTPTRGLLRGQSSGTGRFPDGGSEATLAATDSLLRHGLCFGGGGGLMCVAALLWQRRVRCGSASPAPRHPSPPIPTSQPPLPIHIPQCRLFLPLPSTPLSPSCAVMAWTAQFLRQNF